MASAIQAAATGATMPEAATSTDLRPIPGPAGVVSFDPRVNLLEFIAGLFDQYGDVVGYLSRFGRSVLLAHPRQVQMVLQRENYRRASLVKMMMGDGLLASDGCYWRSQRQLMQKDFLPLRVANFAQIITTETQLLEQQWLLAAKTRQQIDVTMAMTQLTLRIVVKALFSEDLSDDHMAKLCDAVTYTILEVGKVSWTVFGAPFEFTPQGNAQFAAAREVIDSLCYQMISQRKKMAPQDRPRDLLSLLIEAQTDQDPLTDLQIHDEVLTMFISGHETTALALSWAWKLLANHPDVVARLYPEIDHVLGDRPPKASDQARLPWTRSILQESMRLYPPVWYMGRVAMEPDVLDGYVIPKGTCVMIFPWFTHRHKDFWQSPEKFDPTRFVDGAAAIDRHAYVPFAGGRHLCIGMHLAMLESTLILAQLARRFDVQAINSDQVQPLPGITLRQSPHLMAKVRLRNTLSGAGHL